MLIRMNVSIGSENEEVEDPEILEGGTSSSDN